jgi:5-methylcytosine-specific restriction endonuclease McrA
MPHSFISLRPGISNRNQWQGAERKNAVSAKIRKVVLERDGNSCASCGHRAMKWMHVHHIEDEDNDALENLATLCPACHAVMHFGRSMQWGTLEIWKA